MVIKGLIDKVKDSMKQESVIQELIYEKRQQDQAIIDEFYKHCGGKPMQDFLDYLKNQPLSEKRKQQYKDLQKKDRSSLNIDDICDYLELATVYVEGISDSELKAFLLGDNPSSDQTGTKGGNSNG